MSAYTFSILSSRDFEQVLLMLLAGVATLAGHLDVMIYTTAFPTTWLPNMAKEPRLQMQQWAMINLVPLLSEPVTSGSSTC